jgi:hypothetical protein
MPWIFIQTMGSTKFVTMFSVSEMTIILTHYQQGRTLREPHLALLLHILKITHMSGYSDRIVNKSVYIIRG